MHVHYSISSKLLQPFQRGRLRPLCLLVQNRPTPLLAIPSRPNAIPARRKNPIRIQGVFQAFVKTKLRVVVPAVGSSDLVSEEDVSSGRIDMFVSIRYLTGFSLTGVKRGR